MSIQPHPVTITVQDSDSVVVEGASVNIRNTTKGTTSDTETTNSSGIAIIDLANLPIASGETLQYETGDTTLVAAFSSPNSGSSSYTVAGDSKSITITLNDVNTVDVLEITKDLLKDNWNSLATDDMTPVFEKIMELKEYDTANDDYLLLYEPSPEEILPFSLRQNADGGIDWSHKNTVSIDIRTSFKTAELEDIRAHLEKIRTEVERIIKAKITSVTHYAIVKLLRRRDLSDKSIGLGRYVIDFGLEYYGV